MFRFSMLSVALLVATTALGHSSPPPATTNLSPIVVTAPTGTPQPLDATLAPVLVFGPAQLAQFANSDVAALLRFSAGLDIARNGGPGQPASLFLRGTGSAQTLVLIDGIRVNPGAIGGPPLANIRTLSADRIEVVEAPRSALYGSEAIGGVVDIALKQPQRNGFAWGASVNGGHDANRGVSAHADGGDGTLFGGVQASWFETAGFPPLLTSNDASAYRNESIHGVFGAQGQAGEAYATVWRSTGTSDYLDYFGTPKSEDYTDRVASVHLQRQLSANWRARLLLGQFFDGIEQQQSTDYTHTLRNSLDWRNDLNVGTHHLLSLGVYHAHEHVNASSYGSGYDTITRTNAVYTQDQMQYGPHRVVLAARESHFSSFGDQFTWNADYGFAFARGWRVTAGAGTGFRAPTATDRFGYGGNPNLKPEYSHSLNAGLYWRLDDQAAIRFNLYRNRIADLITFEATAAGGQEQNIGRATITGANLSARFRYGRWRIAPGIDIQRPLNDQTGGYLPRRSRRSVTLNLGYDAGHWRAGMHVLASGARKDSDFSNTVDAGYVLTDLTGSVELAAHWRLAGRVENLFNIHYQTAAGYRTPGRGLYLSLQYGID